MVHNSNPALTASGAPKSVVVGATWCGATTNFLDSLAGTANEPLFVDVEKYPDTAFKSLCTHFPTTFNYTHSGFAKGTVGGAPLQQWLAENPVAE